MYLSLHYYKALDGGYGGGINSPRGFSRVHTQSVNDQGVFPPSGYLPDHRRESLTSVYLSKHVQSSHYYTQSEPVIGKGVIPVECAAIRGCEDGKLAVLLERGTSDKRSTSSRFRRSINLSTIRRAWASSSSEKTSPSSDSSPSLSVPA
jgi:hypothetical protein